MPFDQFFSSANKKHYVDCPGVDELYDKVSIMSFEERLALIQEWKKRGLTKIEYIVVRKLKYNSQGRCWANIHRDVEKRAEVATKELKQGKRILRVVTNARHYGTVSGAVNPRQKHSSRH